MSEILVMQGGAIKALGKSTFEGKSIGKVGGILCRYSTPDEPDAHGDYFDAKTDFGLAPGESMKCPVYYHHALDPQVGAMKLGMATLTITDDGVDSVSELDLSNPVALKQYERTERGELGLSSGTASHLVTRTPVATKSGRTVNHIDHWPLGLDLSLTPTPAERRNTAVALKSLIVPEGDAGLKAQVEALEAELKAIRLAKMRRVQMTFIKNSLAQLR